MAPTVLIESLMASECHESLIALRLGHLQEAQEALLETLVGAHAVCLSRGDIVPAILGERRGAEI